MEKAWNNLNEHQRERLHHLIEHLKRNETIYAYNHILEILGLRIKKGEHE